MNETQPGAEEPNLTPIQRWPTTGAKAWVSNFLRSAVLDDNVVAIIAVGSAVRRNVPSVDLDIVVLAKDVSKLESRPPIEIDLRAYPVDQVDSMIAGGSDLLGWSVKYGIPLLQKDDVWNRVTIRWQDSVPLPSAEVATKRAADSLRRFGNMMEVEDYEAAYEQAVSLLTHLARSALIRRGIYPTSRPELPDQLRSVSCDALAESLEKLVKRQIQDPVELARVVSATQPH